MFLIPRLLFAILFFAVTVAFAQTDSVVKSRHSMTVTPSRPNEENLTNLRSVYYVHSPLRRIDSVDATGKVTFIKINNCATRSGFIVDTSSREYRAVKLPHLWSEQETREYIGKHPADAVRIESRTIDTGEKKVLLGLMAKHFITSVERPTKNGAGATETIDAWYVEHQQLECETAAELPQEFSGALLVTYPELADVHHVGPIPRGLVVRETHTIKWTGEIYGGRTLKSERTLESISDSALDPKMFEIPPGFRENPKLLKSR